MHLSPREIDKLLLHQVGFLAQKRLARGLRLIHPKAVAASYGLSKRIEAVRACRRLGKKDMKWNDATPSITVDPATHEVTADGEALVGAQNEVFSPARRYSRF